jgi:hypothetical protein
MANRHRYIQTLLCCLIFLAAFGITAHGQTTVQANRLIAKDSIKIGSRWVYLVDPDSTFSSVSHRAVPTTKAVRDFVLFLFSLGGDVYELDAVGDTTTITDPREGDLAVAPSVLLIRATSAWLQFQGGDDWGDQVVAIDSTLRGNGTAVDPLRVNRDSFPTRTMVEDSIAAVREDILPTNLSFSGLGSPATLESSTGDDVQFAAGAGIGFNVSGVQLTINNTGVTGTSSSTTYLPRWSSLSPPVLAGDNKYRFNDAYPAIEIFGSYNSNSTQLTLSAGGSNPRIQSNTSNNGMVMAVGGNGSLAVQNTTGTTRFEVIGGSSRSYFSTSLGVGLSGTPAARLHTTGSGSTSATFSFLAENSSGTDHFQVRDDGGVFVPVRSGTATNLAGWTSDHRATNTNVSSRLSLSSGTLDINTDSIPTYNIFTKNSSFTANRTGTISEDNYLLFTSTNSESGLPYKCYFGTVEDDIYTGDFVFGRYSLTGDAGNYLMDFDGYSYDEGGNAKYWAASDGSSNSSLTYSASNFQVLVNTTGGLCKIRATDAGVAILEGENGIEFKDGPVTSMMTLNTDAARLESSLVLVNDAADLAEDGQIWKEENRLNFNTANLSTSLSGVMFTGTADATVANTTTETTLISPGDGTVTIPAYYLKVGKTITVEAWGIYTADASPATLEIKASLGGVLLCTTGANTLTTTEGGQWRATITFTCRTTGASGTVMSQGEARFSHAVDAYTTYWMRRSTTNTVNTTSALAFNLTGQHGAADPDNSITLTNIKITIEN